MRRLAIAIVMMAATATAAHAADPLPAAEGPVKLTVSGNISVSNAEGAAEFDEKAWASLPRTKLQTSTTWTDGVPVFEGVLLADVIDRVGGSGSVIVAKAINDYASELPMDDIRRYPVLLADTQDGKPLSVRTKGPLWIIYPKDQHEELASDSHNAKWVWQVRALELK